MQSPKNIAIVGSGLVGSLLAIYLRKQGHRVTIYDRRPDIRNIKFSGRSINLAMSTRGWNALDAVGVGDAVREIAIPMYKRAIHTQEKPLTYQNYGKNNEAIYSISRGVLNKRMIDLAEKSGATFVFNAKVWDVDLPTATLHVGASETDTWEPISYDLVFGADGAFSRVRHRMQRRSMFNYSQEFLETGYKELTIPANPDGSHKLDKNALHIWPRGRFMFIALPNLDGSFTCTLFMPFEGKDSFASITTETALELFFNKHFPVLKQDIDNLKKDFFANPTSALVTIKCFPWTYWDKVALIGDAAHAIVPFFGQGMNAGFEDITVLNELMHTHVDDWETIFTQYQAQRKPNADAIAQLSYDNFMEMSSKTADPSFLLRKKIEKKFADLYPELWVPQYSRVTFSKRPYIEALKEGEKQQKIMDQIMTMPDIETLWDTPKVLDKIKDLLEKK